LAKIANPIEFVLFFDLIAFLVNGNITDFTKIHLIFLIETLLIADKALKFVNIAIDIISYYFIILYFVLIFLNFLCGFSSEFFFLDFELNILNMKVLLVIEGDLIWGDCSL